MTTGGVRNIRVIGLHIEQSVIANTQTGVYQLGTDCYNLVLESMFFWGIKKPIDIAGSCNGLRIDNIYLNHNGHASPAPAAINTSAQVRGCEIGYVDNTSSNFYATIANDLSDSDTRRKTQAGGLPFEVFLAGAQALTNAATDLAGITKTVTPIYKETWIVRIYIDLTVTVTGTGLMNATIVFDGGNQRSVFLDPGAVVGRFGLVTSKIIGGVTPNTAHTVKVQVSKVNAGGTATAQAAHTVMTLERVGE
jgi:hypothetical protein